MPFHSTNHRSSPPKTSWDAVSDWYADYVSKPGTFQKTVIFPGVIRLLKPEADKIYLDIACGEGAFSRDLAKAAKNTVIGFDASPSLVARATKIAPKSIRYFVSDAAKFAHRLEPDSIDGASCILAIQNINPCAPVFLQTARVLKSGAPFVIVLNHPCFRMPRQSGWGWDDQRKLQYRRVDRYLSSYEMPILMHPGISAKTKTYSYHRSLQEYMNELSHAGFAIDAIEEWVSPKNSDSGPRAKAENTARAEIPLFMAIRAIKIRSTH